MGPFSYFFLGFLSKSKFVGFWRKSLCCMLFKHVFFYIPCWVVIGGVICFFTKGAWDDEKVKPVKRRFFNPSHTHTRDNEKKKIRPGGSLKLPTAQCRRVFEVAYGKKVEELASRGVKLHSLIHFWEQLLLGVVALTCIGLMHVVGVCVVALDWPWTFLFFLFNTGSVVAVVSSFNNGSKGLKLLARCLLWNYMSFCLVERVDLKEELLLSAVDHWKWTMPYRCQIGKRSYHGGGAKPFHYCFFPLNFSPFGNDAADYPRSWLGIRIFSGFSGVQFPPTRL